MLRLVGDPAIVYIFNVESLWCDVFCNLKYNLTYVTLLWWGVRIVCLFSLIEMGGMEFSSLLVITARTSTSRGIIKPIQLHVDYGVTFASNRQKGFKHQHATMIVGKSA